MEIGGDAGDDADLAADVRRRYYGLSDMEKAPIDEGDVGAASLLGECCLRRPGGDVVQLLLGGVSDE